ncbi:right-handed parallel beta-helix repeat-containing protein [Streptomyces meridianus]|uniref:Right-handed parallel beta-helix repeat-containing protein n=1 Tax=Streptomyces meridianus TaxID=2938945 RepID=A0ABT0X6I3_9ACTN|nr:right-handed parallel beta-helix repeat-containing protein [Streptomyces meridianus]MCM2577384.1 right-handed parallel beta-helix repeat-containing protein [Streptomyces meridianus]
MTKHQVTFIGWVAAAMVAGLAAAPAAHASDVHLVHSGESIQKAVNAARAGDTVIVFPGTYRESVQIKKSGVTLRGSGSATVLKPSTKKAKNACAKAGNGICVTGTDSKPLRNVSIRSLVVSSFKKNGIWATRTDSMTVRGVTARYNGQWGIAQERSTRGYFRNNTARNNVESGIFLANTIDREGGATDTKGAVVRDNDLTGNRIGVTLRRIRNLSVHHNTISGNCGGVFVVGDEGVPAAGDMTIRSNIVYKNNKFCAGNSRLPAIQGAGIVLTGAQDTTVSRNFVADNNGSSPLSGGIVLFKSFVGAPNSNNVIRDNMAQRNLPADLADRDTGTGNRFTRNSCTVSEPTGRC